MAEIIPAIMPLNYEDLKNKTALVRGLAPVVQVDIADGIFVKNLTWPFFTKTLSGETFLEHDIDQHFRAILNEQDGLPFWEDIDFELDLMVADAVENFDLYAKLGPKRIIFHLEAVGDLAEFKDFLEGIDLYIKDNIQLGLAINPDTSMEQIFPLINSVDFIQCMGIRRIGFQGQDFDPQVVDNVKKLKEKFPDLIIAVDGGVNFETAPALISAGAERLVIGSAIFNTNDIIDTIENFKSL